eukprot:3113513-Heterocapsa_arctica.AAC.2
MRPTPIVIPEQDLNDQDMEVLNEQNFIMGGQITEEEALRELIALGGAAIMVRTRATGSSNENAM